MHEVIKRLIWGQIPFRKVVLGKDSLDYVGAYGATPVIQPTAAAQAAVTTTAITAVTTTNTTPVSGTELVSLFTAVNAIITRQALIITLVNRIRTDLITLGWIKGS
jgi:hypothetical protein